MKTSSHLGWLWLQACPPQHLCRLLEHLTGSSGSLMGVLVCLFWSTDAGEDICLDCTLMLRLASICQPSTGSIQPQGEGDCLAGDAMAQCHGGTLFALTGLRSSSAIGPWGSGCIFWAVSIMTLLLDYMGGVSISSISDPSSVA